MLAFNCLGNCYSTIDRFENCQHLSAYKINVCLQIYKNLTYACLNTVVAFACFRKCWTLLYFGFPPLTALKIVNIYLLIKLMSVYKYINICLFNYCGSLCLFKKMLDAFIILLSPLAQTGFAKPPPFSLEKHHYPIRSFQCQVQ